MDRLLRIHKEILREKMSGRDKAFVLNHRVPKDRGKRGLRFGSRLEARKDVKGRFGPNWAAKLKFTPNGARRALGFNKNGHRSNPDSR